MKKFFVVSLILSLLCSCQDGGVVKSYYENGNLRSELKYNDGKLNGECKWYYESGKPMMVSTYVMGVLEGEAWRWYENGQKEAHFFFKNNKKDGVSESFNVAGILVKKETYKDGVLNGGFSQWYDNGALFVEGGYLDGMMHGSWMIFYDDGTVASNAIYEKGTGVQRGFNQGGGYTVTLIHYKDNQKDGEEIHYSPDGRVTEILLWKNGEYQGKK